MTNQQIDLKEQEIRRRVKDVIKNREDHWMSFIDRMPSMIHSIDNNGRLLNVSNCWLEKIGYKREEVIGHKSVEFLTEESRRFAESVTIPEFMKTGYARDIPYKFITKSGQIVDVLLSAIAESDEDGNYTKSLAILTDITAQKRAEEDLQNEKIYLETLFQNAPEAIAVLDNESNVLDLNEEFSRLFGYTLKEVKGHHINDLVIPPELKDEGDSYTRSVQNGERLYAETRRMNKDGSLVDISLLGAPILNTKGEQKGTFAIYRDLTEAHNFQRLLSNREQRLESILDNASNAIVTIDEKGIIESFNKAAATIFGYTEDEVINENVKILMSEPDSSKHGSYLDNYHRTGISTIVGIVREVVGQRKNGETFPLKLSVSQVNLDSGTVYTGIIEDLTEQKQIESDNLDLQAKLLQAQRMESLGLLAGGVAHDLNNIIGPIMAYPELIKMSLIDGESVEDDLDAISSSAQRAADVIADLLALTRRGRYKMESLDLNELIKDFLSSAECKSIIKLNPDADPDIQLSENKLLIKGSKSHMPKVIMNLINNACESMPEGGVLTVTTCSINVEGGELINKNIPQGRYILLTIEDQGEGISKEHISKIFDPFFTTKMKSGKSGTGLGLSVVYNVLKDHDAFIDVESKLGVGTKFSIYFPQTAEKIESPSEPRLDNKGSGNILVVDDRKEQRDIAKRLLTSLGYDVVCVERGQEAVEYVKGKDVDLILLDMILEDDMDGLDVYKEIIKIKPEQKTVIVSGFSESDRVKEAEELGVNGFLQKPYKIDEIRLTLQNLLDVNHSS
ncbi:MAG: PAS domain S-box protein [Candidatus Marinimicrobia bacterium]|nr:PAS domain S-box protein [Candidatus Neomarinimicrobiota bacterium]